MEKKLSFWFTIFGILLNFFGTLLLIFSIPTSFREENGHLLHVSGNPWDLFKYQVIEKKDSAIIIALILLVIGVVFQISVVLI